MPFFIDSNPTQSEVSDAVNYLLSNFSANLSSDPSNGQITGGNGQIIGYLYKYMMVKYADSFDGSLNFSNTQTNRLYYGLRNDNSSTESTNPADYIWYKVAGSGFGTTKTLYYKVTGGRSITFNVATTSPGYAWVPDTGAAIDLDALTMAFTVNVIIYKFGTSTPPARPTTTTTYDWTTGTYTAPSGWSTFVPSGGSPGNYLWSISILITQTGGLQSSLLDWTNTAYPIVAVGIFGQNGQNGNSGLVAYLVQSQASPTPAFSATTTGPNPPSGWSLTTPSVSVGQVLWYVQGQYNSSTTDTINGVAPNTTAWTGPIAASIFQDIRSDNWDGSNPPTPGNPTTYGTQGYYIQRNTGAVYLNSVFARNYIQVGGSAADINANTTTITGSKITTGTITATQIAANTITAGQLAASYIVVGNAASDVNSGTTTINGGQITANTIAANKLNVSQLSAITADLGTITAGDLSVGSSPAISGTTMTGTGAHLYSDGRFVVGNSTKNMVFDASNLYLNGISTATMGGLSTGLPMPSSPSGTSPTGYVDSFVVTKAGYVQITLIGEIVLLSNTTIYPNVYAPVTVSLRNISGGSLPGTSTSIVDTFSYRVVAPVVQPSFGSATNRLQTPLVWNRVANLPIGTYAVFVCADAYFNDAAGNLGYTVPVNDRQFNGRMNIFQSNI